MELLLSFTDTLTISICQAVVRKGFHVELSVRDYVSVKGFIIKD